MQTGCADRCERQHPRGFPLLGCPIEGDFGGGAVMANPNGLFTLPVEFAWITSGYSDLRDYDGDGLENDNHGGIDYDTADYGTAIYAAASGFAWINAVHYSYGNHVIITHDFDGNGSVDYTTLYAHLSVLSVTEGQWISQGEVLGEGGSTGMATGSHLHFETRYGHLGSTFDPYDIYEDLGSEYPDDNTNVSCGADHVWTQCPPVVGDCNEGSMSGPYDVTIVHVEEDGIDYDVDSWYETNPGDQMDRLGEVISNTGSTSNNKVWLTGEVSGDSYQDIVQITTTSSPHTYAQVYLSTGSGNFGSRTEWRRTSTRANQAFLGDVNGDGLNDLILGYKDSNNDNKITWKTCESTGASFGACATWQTDQVDNTFGQSTDVFVVGDFNGNGKVEILRGREQSLNSCSGKLKWKRLSTNGTTTVINDCWGYASSPFTVADIDADGSDEIVHIRTDDSEVEVYVGHYSGSVLVTEQWADDVGSTDGWYYVFDVDKDGYVDLVRWSSINLQWMRNTGSSFQNQGSSEMLVSSLLRADGDYLLLGQFGQTWVYSEEDCSDATIAAIDDYDGDGWPDDVDCAWWDANSYPGAPELADWNDNDCDGSNDEGCTYDCGGVYWDGCWDDYASFYNSGSLTFVCTGVYTPAPADDYDGDGWPDDVDCAWWDANSYPGAPELADWNDNDCDGSNDEGCNGNCGGYYGGGCNDDYEWWYLGVGDPPEC
ncbi:MAG: M23 family metallopeptidase [bacterium]|nr:M23 family metallopeptidase [bacterium]